MRNPPTISVITPTLNAARTLERCLASVRAQEYPAGAVEMGGALYVYAMRVTHWAKRLNASDSVHAYGVLFSGRLGEGIDRVRSNLSGHVRILSLSSWPTC